jgi:hypothetical protein
VEFLQGYKQRFDLSPLHLCGVGKTGGISRETFESILQHSRYEVMVTCIRIVAVEMKKMVHMYFEEKVQVILW